jgi:arabinofuranan 3-O-arabinosyltransferase
VRATATSRAFGLPTVRASQALDGRPDTAWLPAVPVVGQSLRISAPPRRVDHVSLTQVGRHLTDWATRVQLSLDGRVVATAPARLGTTRISFPARTASRLELTVLATHSGRPDASVRISEVDFGGARIRGSGARPCVPVSTVDGHALLMRPVAPVTTDDPVPWVGCGSLFLGPGQHRVRPVAGWQPDQLALRDTLGPGERRPPPGPRYSVAPGRAGSATVRVSSANGAWYLISGQAYDPRWRASVDGHDLGPPILVDGYAAGWRVDLPGTTHVATIRYGPQRITDAGFALSGATVLGCLALLLLRAPPRRIAFRRGPPAVAVPTGPAPDVPTWTDGHWTAPPVPDADWSPPRDRPPAAGPTADARSATTAPAADTGTPTTAPGTARSPVEPAAAIDGAGGTAAADGWGSGRGGVRRVAGWVAVAVLAWVLGGAWLGVAAVLLAGWHLVRAPRPRTLILAAAALLAAVPVVWLALRPDISGGLSAHVVADDLWPHRLAALALLLLAVGVTRAERGRR